MQWRRVRCFLVLLIWAEANDETESSQLQPRVPVLVLVNSISVLRTVSYNTGEYLIY